MTDTPPHDGAQKRRLSADGMRCSSAERDRTAVAISTATGE